MTGSRSGSAVDHVRWIQSPGLSKRRGLQLVRMTASAPRCQRRPDRNQALRARIGAASSSPWCRDDLPEAAPGRSARQSQAGRVTAKMY